MAVMGMDDPDMLLYHLMRADEFGVKLEVEGSTQRWEFFPSPLHQAIIRDIDRAIRPKVRSTGSECDCYTLSDFYLRLRDGSLKRPDLAIYCKKPIVGRDALDVIPGAVIEILSPGSEEKDLVTGPPLYLSSGVLDVIVVNHEKGEVTHFRQNERRSFSAPAEIELEMGCLVTI
ncbi:Uma2 family endonuclease [bacterium]|nr:MAG: Uma2 family endonuclease [bacterium]